MITTRHQYLDKYPISNDSERLIVGTIHPHNHDHFLLPFFYGNKTSIWTILSDAFPYDLKQPITLDGILKFLKMRKISLSDTVRICKRKNLSALDQDLIPVELNTAIIDDIKHSKITEVFFTSGFGKNNAFKLFFVDLLKQKITPEIRENRGILLDKKHFGRPIKLTVLYSPAGTANIGLSKSKIFLKNKDLFANSNRPIYDFKVWYYQNMFS